MAIFVELGSENTVLRSVVVLDSECLDEQSQHSEAHGIAFCQSIYGEATDWRQAFYDEPEEGSWARDQGTGLWHPA